MKQYYTRKEVAEILGVSESTILLWQEEFYLINRQNSIKGLTKFTLHHIEIIEQIKNSFKTKPIEQ